MIRFSTAILATAIAFAPPVAAQPVQRYETKGQAPVNSWWIATPDGGLVVFDALRSFTDTGAAVSAIRKTGRPVRAIFITHPHPDHVTGLGIYREAFPTAKIYSSHAAQDFLEGEGKTLLTMNVKSHAGGDATDTPPPPDVFLTDGEKLSVGGLDIAVRFIGDGESPGATAYYIASRSTLVLGDVLTPNRRPLMAAGRTAAWLEQIAVVKQAYPSRTIVLPGHGPQTTLARAARWQQAYLERFRHDVGRALLARSSQGACVTQAEGAAIQADMDKRFPVVEQVAQIPPAMINSLNLDGVTWEVKGKLCTPIDNPIRGK